MYRIGVDVGGTFTDLVAVDETGQVTLTKVASTPEDQSLGVMDGLARMAEGLGVRLGELLAQTERIVHGTTVATNALLERKGARVGLLTGDNSGVDPELGLVQGHRLLVRARDLERVQAIVTRTT